MRRSQEGREVVPANIEGGCQPELEALVQVVEPDGSPECSQLGHTCGHTMGGGPHLCWVQLSSQQEGGAIGSKLPPERGEEVNLQSKGGLEPKSIVGGWDSSLTKTKGAA